MDFACAKCTESSDWCCPIFKSKSAVFATTPSEIEAVIIATIKTTIDTVGCKYKRN